MGLSQQPAKGVQGFNWRVMSSSVVSQRQYQTGCSRKDACLGKKKNYLLFLSSTFSFIPLRISSKPGLLRKNPHFLAFQLAWTHCETRLLLARGQWAQARMRLAAAGWDCSWLFPVKVLQMAKATTFSPMDGGLPPQSRSRSGSGLQCQVTLLSTQILLLPSRDP